MKGFIINGTLSPKHREASLELIEDDHTIELKHDSEIIARFSATGVKIQEIYKEADEWLRKNPQRL